MKLTRPVLLTLTAIVCFAIGWIVTAGHQVFGTPTEWLFAGLIALTATHLP